MKYATQGMRSALQLARTMAVPKMSQLRLGLGVNVVLKTDQKCGKLTSGRISEILTKGDHPRGIKVRLSDGQIGRVQSLSVNPDSSVTVQPVLAACSPQESSTDYFPQQSRSTGRGERRDRLIMQDDYRKDPTPVETRSLMDYVKVPPPSKAKLKNQSSHENSVQGRLEKDFPKLDTALIAVILADHHDVEAARDVLNSLS